ncbi:MAG TPA: YicC/YloC family endoribonuclease, partial [Candidatus Methylomirabilis sp.]|nr:YicC/YloC family endoribonuclease [Candidatus Methylomirabilis sp.]
MGLRASMTGFGRGEATAGGRTFTVEVQSVNHRFLEVRSRVPKRLTSLEPRIQQAVQERFSRGHFEVTILEKGLDSRGRTLKIDVPLAMQYVDALRSLQQALSLPGEVTLEMLTAQRDLIAVEEDVESVDASWAEVLPALAKALDALTEMRRHEGEALVV